MTPGVPVPEGELPDGRTVHRLVLGAAPGPVLELLTLGATMHRLVIPVGDGAVSRSVLLGSPSIAERLKLGCYLGVSVGRYANRIGGARFPLDGREVRLLANDGANTLHGGPAGFDRLLWTLEESSADHAVLGLVSPDGDQGFPGELRVTARFEVSEDAVRITYAATTDAPTVVNLTSHPYVNLDGEGVRDITDHELVIPADAYTPRDVSGIPLGDHEPVAGTPFDLRAPRRLGDSLVATHPQVTPFGGFDHNFVVGGTGLREVARLTSSDRVLQLRLRSDQPGLQVYTGNGFDGTEPDGAGGHHARWAGVALEPQHYPDSPNHPDWPSTVLRPGEEYRTVTEWGFGPG